MTQKSFLLLLISFLIFFSFSQTGQAQNGTLYFSPATGTFRQGDSFWLTIMVNTKGEVINAVAAYLSYPEDKLEPLGVSVSGSVLTIWAEKNAGGGKIEIAGGLPTPGFSGIKKIASIGFKAKVSSGSVNLKFSQDSAVLRDSDNTNILNLTLSGQGNYNFLPKEKPPIEVEAPVISDVEVREISQTEAIISWKTDVDADSIIEYGLTTDYGSIVSSEELTKEHSLVISELSPGARYYFKVKSKEPSGEESEIKDLHFSTLGYQVEIKVLDPANNQPLVGAEVIFSGPPEISKTTDEDGKVVFDHLPLGNQWISVKYQDISLNYLIEVLAKEELQGFSLGFELPRQKPKVWLISVIIILVVLVIFVLRKLLKRKETVPIGTRGLP